MPSERETTNSHAESLDTKAGVVLGLAGVLVSLGATAQPVVSGEVTFQLGLGFGVAAALTAALAFLLRKYPVVQVLALRDLLTATEDETKLALLDAQIDMVIETATLVKRKGGRVKTAVALLAMAAALVVVGKLFATGGSHHVRSSTNARSRSGPAEATRAAAVPPGQEPHRLHREGPEAARPATTAQGKALKAALAA